MYTNGSNSAIPLRVTGNYLAHRRLSKRQRAIIAASAMDGRTEFVEMTQTQIARHCGVSLAYARLLRRANSVPPVVQLAAE
jgi:hypothetical protein